MSETLSYQEPAPTELNEAEQEALEVGEQMEADQNQLLAGKYKSAGDLEKAYLELQQKLGTKEEEQPEEQVEEPQEETPENQQDDKSESEDQPSTLTQEDINYLHGLAGGTEGYQQMVTWASSTSCRSFGSATDVGVGSSTGVEGSSTVAAASAARF